MQRIPVESSNVASVGYDRTTLTMEVEFHNGSVYQYFDVPEQLYNGLLADSSPGGFLNSQIKGNYRYAKI